jgi:hypothetical protein
MSEIVILLVGFFCPFIGYALSALEGANNER